MKNAKILTFPNYQKRLRAADIIGEVAALLAVFILTLTITGVIAAKYTGHQHVACTATVGGAEAAEK